MIKLWFKTKIPRSIWISKLAQELVKQASCKVPSTFRSPRRALSWIQPYLIRGPNSATLGQSPISKPEITKHPLKTVQTSVSNASFILCILPDPTKTSVLTSSKPTDLAAISQPRLMPRPWAIFHYSWRRLGWTRCAWRTVSNLISTIDVPRLLKLQWWILVIVCKRLSLNNLRTKF